MGQALQPPWPGASQARRARATGAGPGAPAVSPLSPREREGSTGDRREQRPQPLPAERQVSGSVTSNPGVAAVRNNPAILPPPTGASPETGDSPGFGDLLRPGVVGGQGQADLIIAAGQAPLQISAAALDILLHLKRGPTPGRAAVPGRNCISPMAPLGGKRPGVEARFGTDKGPDQIFIHPGKAAYFLINASDL